MTPNPLPHIVVLGGGFGGLWTTRALAGAPVRITLVDRANHHLFQPLLYQVATAGLSSPDIAAPLRHILRGQRNVTVRLDTALRIDPAQRYVECADGTLDYDFLVVATGATHAYFGHENWAQHAPGLKGVCWNPALKEGQAKHPHHARAEHSHGGAHAACEDKGALQILQMRGTGEAAEKGDQLSTRDDMCEIDEKDREAAAEGVIGHRSLADLRGDDDRLEGAAKVSTGIDHEGSRGKAKQLARSGFIELPQVRGERRLESARKHGQHGTLEDAAASVDEGDAEEAPAAKPKRTRKPRGAKAEAVEVVAEAAEVVVEAAAEPVAEEKPAPKKRASRAKAAAPEAVEPVVAEVAPKPKGRSRAKAAAEPAVDVAAEVAPALVVDPGLTPVAETVVADPGEASAPEPVADDPAKPKRKGWWSLGR